MANSLQSRALEQTGSGSDIAPPPLPASLSGDNHPLNPAAPKSTSSGAVEVVTEANGQTEQEPLSKLSAGDHTIQFQDGRQFLVHIPKTDSTAPLPVMFVFSGSAEPQWNIKDFAPESGMNSVADEDPNHPFAVVYPLAEKHKIGIYSKQAEYGWNAPGSLIGDADYKAAGYDDTDYVKSIATLMPQLANVDASHKDWGAVAFSQGGPFLNSLVANVPNLFPSIDLVGSTMQKGYDYKAQPGNAQNVEIVELLGDKSTLPIRGLTSQNWSYDKSVIARWALRDINIFGFHGNSVIDGADPLAAIHNEDQSPMLQNQVYIGRLGKEGQDYTVKTADLTTPVASAKKDFETDYTPVNASDNRRVTVFGLAEAMHSYPAPLYGPRTNAQPKYTEFDASRQFAKVFDQYNDRVHAGDGH